MNKMRRLLIPIFLAALVAAVMPLTALAATDPFSGGSNTAGNYAVMAGTTITASGPASWVTGKMALSPGSSITGFPPSTSGHEDVANPAAVTAQGDLTTAYTTASPTGNTPCTTEPADLSGLTLGPGIYCDPSAGTFGLTGTLTLNGAGLYIFQMASTLSTGPGAVVSLIGGALPCDIYWQVGSSAVIGSSATFVGNILALTSITLGSAATLNGRALARNGAVSLNNNRIIQATGCGYAAPTYVAPPAGTALPATLAPSSPIVGLPATGVPSQLLGEIPWLLMIGLGSGLAVVALGISSRRRRRRLV